MTVSWKQVVPAILIGAVAGSAATVGAFKYKRSVWRDPAKRHERMLERFSKELDLSSEQKQKVSAIFESTRERLDALGTQTRPKFEALKAQADAEIRVLLSPEQQSKFDELQKKWEKKRRRRGKPDLLH